MKIESQSSQTHITQKSTLSLINEKITDLAIFIIFSIAAIIAAPILLGLAIVAIPLYFSYVIAKKIYEAIKGSNPSTFQQDTTQSNTNNIERKYVCVGVNGEFIEVLP